MKKKIAYLSSAWGLCSLLMLPAIAQEKLVLPHLIPPLDFTHQILAQPALENLIGFRIPGKTISRYKAEDWGTLIDSTWGPGQPAVEQLRIFDAFWDTVDTHWAGFPNIALNWDSLRNVYRPQIGSGLSRGRFYGLMSRMWLALTEFHSAIVDLKVDTVFGSSTFSYRRGIPLLLIGSWNKTGLGAAVTPMADSTNLVYRVASTNPLGLVPGDLVLGYHGIPWKNLYESLIDAGVPVDWWYSSPGATPEAKTYALLSCVGNNWGMFDTIDVVKYASGSTLHLPTAPLLSLTQTVWASDQVPIAGVPMPDPQLGNSVSWGVVQSTNIGYIYVWDWASVSTQNAFLGAVNDLCRTRKVGGLIIDFRMNWGGDPTYANAGLAQLFNIDPSPNLLRARRNNPTNHLAFSSQAFPTSWYAHPWTFSPTTTPYDRPIAVLIGPGCYSAGDRNAVRMRFHPMARFFGKPTNGSNIGGDFSMANLSDAWYYQVPTSTVFSTVPGGGYLIHKGVQPDEEVWLTRDGVANGEDEVVKRALAWINILSYAHDVKISRDTLRSSADSLAVTAKVQNPGAHTLVVSAIVTNAQGAQVDSLLFVNDGLHGDGAAGDSTWGAFIKTPAGNGRYMVSVRTDDKTTLSFRRLPNAVSFTVTLTGVGDLAGKLPTHFSLEQNYPNPFNPATNIQFSIVDRRLTIVRLYDVLGRELTTLVNEVKGPGTYTVQFDGSNLASGVYLYRLTAGSFVHTRKLLLMR